MTNSDPRKQTDVSVIVPTFREGGNLTPLIERLETIRHHFKDLQLILVDDNSDDGTPDIIRKLDKPWVQLMTRVKERGLSSAVMRGLESAKTDVLVVMDADLSHPPEKIPEMVEALLSPNTDFVIGSRYVEGGSIHEDWTLFRYFNSKVSSLLARPFTKAQDPMSGFFSLKRSTFEKGRHDVNPIGFKIGLELIVKCECRNIKEVPIHFADRLHGESKLSFRAQLQYLKQVADLAKHKYT